MLLVWLGGQTVSRELPAGGLLGSGVLGCAPSDLNDQVLGAGGPVVSGTCDVQESGSVHAVAVRWERDGLGNYHATALDPLYENESCTTVDINKQW